MRAGQFISQPTGYKAFIPKPLPPTPALAMDEAMQRLLSEANVALGRLDGVAAVLPSVDLFVAMYVRQEAVLSSQIEGTQCTLDDVLHVEAHDGLAPADAGEVVNYIRAMNHGLGRLPDLPLSLRLIGEVHAELMKEGRGGHKQPGEFRRSQNWIGGRSPSDAAFVPPPPEAMHNALGDLEKFLHDRSLPPLVHCALAHAQFETIHPFLDGNGRAGRLLITLLLCERGLLHRPLLYLSLFLKAHRTEYYDRLTAVRMQGDWENWVAFFLRGVAETSRNATATAHAILAMRTRHAALFPDDLKSKQAVDFLCHHPVVSVRMLEAGIACSFATAAKIIGDFEKHGLLEETTGRARNRLWRYTPYVRLFGENAPLPAANPS